MTFCQYLVEIEDKHISIYGLISFWTDGTMSFASYADIREDLTPAQMWEIIKNLVGE